MLWPIREAVWQVGLSCALGYANLLPYKVAKLGETQKDPDDGHPAQVEGRYWMLVRVVSGPPGLCSLLMAAASFHKTNISSSQGVLSGT